MNKPRPAFRNLVLLPLLLTLALWGCAPMEFSHVQNLYNAAAEADNAGREQLARRTAAAEDGESLEGITGPVGYYAPRGKYLEALEAVNKLIDKKSAKLDKDKLLPNAYSIKALCLWRLGDYQAARVSAGMALNKIDDYTGFRQGGDPAEFVRDVAVMAALPGLIALDTCYANLRTHQITDRNIGSLVYKDSAGRTSGVAAALTVIEDAKGLVSESHPVQNFLLFAQLAGIKTWADALQEIDDCRRAINLRMRDEKDGLSPERLQDMKARSERMKAFYKEQYEGPFKRVKEQYMDKLLKRFPKQGTANHPVYAKWEERL